MKVSPYSARELQLLATVNGGVAKAVQSHDLRITAAFAKKALRNFPEKVTFDHRVFQIGFDFLLRINAGAVIRKNIVAGILVCLFLGVGQYAICAELRFGVGPAFPYAIVSACELLRINNAGILIVVSLSISGTLCLNGGTLICGTPILRQHCRGSICDGCCRLQRFQKGFVSFRELLPYKATLLFTTWLLN